MNHAVHTSEVAQTTHLLDAIKLMRRGVGDGLNDRELTRFLRHAGLPAELGFCFLSYSDEFVTLTVPKQDPATWYPPNGWISADKARVAQTIAAKYELTLFEPVDKVGPLWQWPETQCATHHHLELCSPWHSVVIAHPEYLKVRLFGRLARPRYPWGGLCPLPLGPDFLKDLSTLYEPSAGAEIHEAPSRHR